MPDPSLISALAQGSRGMQFFGALSSAYGAFAGARTARKNLRFQADMDRINAQLAERQAQQELLTGQRQEQASRLRTAGIKGSQRAAMAANGIDLASGTAQNILNGTDIMGDIDANTIAANAVKSAWGYRTQGVNYNNAANLADASASGINPGVSATTSLLGSATAVAPQWYRFAQNWDGMQTLRTPNPRSWTGGDGAGSYGGFA